MRKLILLVVLFFSINLFAGDYATRMLIKSFRDEVNGSFITENVDHTAIHKGYTYVAAFITDEIAAGATWEVMIQTPLNDYVHIKDINVVGQGAELLVKLIHSATITNEGDTLECISNMNQNSTLEAETVFKNHNTTYTGGQCFTFIKINGSSTNQISNGGGFSQNPNLEYVLKPNQEKYVLTVRNLSIADAASYVAINVTFYEEPKGLIETGY